MSKGYFLIWRSIQDNPLWKEKPFSRGQAWVDLIMMAQHSDGDIHLFKKGVIIEAKRGDVLYGLDFLMKRWGWGKGKVIRFKEYLLTQRMANDVSNQRKVRHERRPPRTPDETPETGTGLEIDKERQTEAYPRRTPSAYPRFTVLSIENYSYYQGEAIKDRTPSAYPPNKLISKEYMLKCFERFWKEYPKKVGKKKAREKFIQLFLKEKKKRNYWKGLW